MGLLCRLLLPLYHSPLAAHKGPANISPSRRACHLSFDLPFGSVYTMRKVPSDFPTFEGGVHATAMAKFTLTGFADEISPVLDEQLRVLNKLSIAYLEPRVVDGKNIADYTPAQAAEVKRRLHDKGVRVSAVGSPMGKISIEEDFAPHLDKFKNLLEVTRALDCDSIRMFSFFIPEGKDPWAYEGAVFDRLSAFVEAARGSGVRLLHENEKAIFGDVPERCLRIHQTFPQILCTFDPSNYVQCGVDTKQAFETLLPYIRYMHMKDSVYVQNGVYRDHGFENVSDAHRPVGLGDGQVPYILSRLRDLGYDGFLSIEPHLSASPAFGKDGEEKFTTAANAFCKLLQEIGE